MSAMSKRRGRTLEELYNATEDITEPGGNTPVLRATNCMQGPVDETIYEGQKDTVSSGSNKVFSRTLRKQKVHMKVESGTCNVCSAPCSSCLHVNRALMASKAEGSSDGISRENTSYSVNNVKPTAKNATHEFGKRTASEASNLISVNSSHDSLSENAESKTNTRTDDTSGAFEDVEIPPKLSIDSDKGNSTVKSDNLSLEGHDDNISCFSVAKEASTLSGSDIGNKANKNSLVSEGNGKNISSQTASECLDSKSNVEKIHPISLSTEGNVPVKKEPPESMQTKEVISGTLKDNEAGLDGVNYESSTRNCPKLKASTDNNDCILPAEALNSVKVNQEGDKNRGSVVLHNAKETSSHPHHVDESDDESDIVEQDVKVCDICGDAGREDLLAVCCRCSDGAEHTYCMRERMDEVPEGDWLCEECMLEDEIKNQKQEKSVTVDGVEKTQSSGQTGAENTTMHVNTDSKASDIDGNKTSKDRTGAKVSHKRPAEEIEVSSSAKKQAVESNKESPKMLSPSKTGALSRDSSFKNLERGKVKPAHQFNLAARSIDDTAETISSPTTGPRSQTPRGAFSKSSSFNFTNAKPKLKIVDDVPQKLKSTKESVYVDSTRDGASRVIGKSTSFKSVYSGRLNTGESKLKMLSPKSSPVQDLKGVKHTKERSYFERKNSFKFDRPFVNSSIASSTATMVKNDQKSSRAETASVSSTSNNREVKSLQSVSKSVTSTKSTNYFSRRGSELPSPLGEVKRQLSSLPGSGNSLEQKPVLASPRYDSLSNCITPGGGRSVPSEKCKETDHSSHFPTVDSPRFDSKSSREAMSKGNKLKAAIEAAMLKKPGIYRKNKNADHSDDLSVSSTKSEVPSQDQPSSIYTRNPIPAEDVNEGQAINAGSYKQPIASTASSVLLKMLTIPEHEYVWQGSFEVHSSGKTLNLCDGFQAHLSTSASPRVLEAVNKFPHKVLLDEVPRLSTWPVQFEENGVKEDNIALYFFAKDLESFDKCYMILLESMMRSDLALKANIDGVELLIFPSNQLPEKSQRWNMLYYLWGVFRGKRVNSTQQVSASPKKLSIPQNTPTAIMSFPDNICAARPIDKDLPMCDATSKVHPLPSLPSSETVNGECDTKVSSFIQKVDCIQLEDTERHDCRADSVPPVQNCSVQPCLEEGAVDNDLKVDTEQLHTSSQIRRPVTEKMPIDLDVPLEDEQNQSPSPNLNEVPSDARTLNVVSKKNNVLDENSIKELDSWQNVNNNRKRSHLDSSTPSGTATNSLPIDGGNTSKKQKTGFNVLYRGSDYETALPNLNEEMYLFPVGPHQENEVGLDGKSIPWIGLSSDDEDKPPNLELALGAETKSFKQDTRNSNHKVQPPDKAAEVAADVATIDDVEEDVSASLSLSLSFPFPDKDRTVQSVPTTREQLITERRHVNPSLVLFGSFSDK